MPGFWGPDPPGDLPEKSVLILYGMGGYPGPPLGGYPIPGPPLPWSGTPPTLVRDPPWGGYPGGPWGGTLGYPGGYPPTLVWVPPPTLVRDPPTLPWVPPYPGPGPPYPTLGTPLPWVPPWGVLGVPPYPGLGDPPTLPWGGTLGKAKSVRTLPGGPGISLFGTHRVGVLKVGTFQDPRLESLRNCGRSVFALQTMIIS